MVLSHEVIQYTMYGIAAAAAILLVARRGIRSVERRIGVLLLILLLLTLDAFLIIGVEFLAPADLLLSLLLIELGVLARIYDSYRTFKSISGTLKNIANLYIFTGLVCLQSRLTDFPVWLWAIPVLLFSAGYFFLRRRKGVANVVCKGLGVLVSVGFIASMLYDVREGAAPRLPTAEVGGRLLPEVVKPSIVDQLNALNEKVGAAEAEKKHLAENLDRSTAACRVLETKLAMETSARKEAEGQLATLRTSGIGGGEAVKRAMADVEDLQGIVKKEQAARAEAELKLAELEKAKTAAKEGFTAIEEKLNLAAENLKKVMAERDAIKAELTTLRNTPTPTPGVPPEAKEVLSLKSQLKQKDEELARLNAEARKLRETIQKVREALEREAGTAAENAPRR
jgi:hypothetical protein